MSQSRLAAIAAKSTIAQYAQGAAREATSPVADFLAPTVEVSSPTGYYRVYDDKTRFVVPDTRRAIGGRATLLGWEKTDATFNCAPHALDVPVDQMEGMADDGIENSLKEAADLAAEVGGLAHEKTTIDAAIAAVTAGVEEIDFAAAADVVDQIDTFLIEVIKAARYGSLMGLSLLFGPTYFRRLKNHPSIKARFPVGKNQVVNPTESDIMGLFITKPDFRLSLMVADSAPMGKDASVNFLLDDKLLVFARKANPTRRDPSFMKTFRLRGAWMAPRVYQRDDGRVEVAAMDWSEQVVVTNSSAAQLLSIKAGS